MPISSYLQEAMDPDALPGLVDSLVYTVHNRGLVDQFDTIAFRGLSGSLVAPLLAVRLGKHMLACRKEESTHGNLVEAPEGVFQYLIVDDLIASGSTVNAIIAHVEVCRPAAKCIGVLLYNQYHIKHDYNEPGTVPVPVFQRRLDVVWPDGSE